MWTIPHVLSSGKFLPEKCNKSWILRANFGFETETRLKGEVEAAQTRLNAYLARIGQDRSGGLQLLAEVRRDFPNTPIVFYTRKGTLEDVNACLDAGAAAVLKKPQPESIDPTLDIYSQLESAAQASKTSLLTRLEAVLATKPTTELQARFLKREDS